MNLLVLTIYAWFGMLVLKAIGFPGVKELSWKQLFLIPVVVFVFRLLLILGWWLLVVLGIFSIYWFCVWALANLDLPTGY